MLRSTYMHLNSITRFGSTINRKRDKKTGERLQRVSEGEGERKMNKKTEVRRFFLSKTSNCYLLQ